MNVMESVGDTLCAPTASLSKIKGEKERRSSLGTCSEEVEEEVGNWKRGPNRG